MVCRRYSKPDISSIFSAFTPAWEQFSFQNRSLFEVGDACLLCGFRAYIQAGLRPDFPT